MSERLPKLTAVCKMMQAVQFSSFGGGAAALQVSPKLKIILFNPIVS
jgi:hypothetical protein